MVAPNAAPQRRVLSAIPVSPNWITALNPLALPPTYRARRMEFSCADPAASTPLVNTICAVPWVIVAALATVASQKLGSTVVPSNCAPTSRTGLTVRISPIGVFSTVKPYSSLMMNSSIGLAKPWLMRFQLRTHSPTHLQWKHKHEPHQPPLKRCPAWRRTCRWQAGVGHSRGTALNRLQPPPQPQKGVP